MKKINILEFDRLLDMHDPEYNSEECTYKGKLDYSISKYIKEKFGKKIYQLVNDLI